MSMESIISLIRQGETVAPGVANRATRELDKNVKYLWGIIEAAALGSTVIADTVSRTNTIVTLGALGEAFLVPAVNAPFTTVTTTLTRAQENRP
jgi:hypothetical protein